MKNEIIKTIEKLFEQETAYRIAKDSGLPKMTVTDLKMKRTSLLNAKFDTVITLYEYAKAHLNE